MPNMRYIFILHLSCLFYLISDQNDINGKGGIWKGEHILINFKDIKNYKPKTKIIVIEENQPNLDRMAEAIWKLLRK